MTIKKIKKQIRKFAHKVMGDPLTKEFLEDEKTVARKSIGRVAKRAKGLVEKEKKRANKAIGKASDKAKKFVRAKK